MSMGCRNATRVITGIIPRAKRFGLWGRRMIRRRCWRWSRIVMIVRMRKMVRVNRLRLMRMATRLRLRRRNFFLAGTSYSSILYFKHSKTLLTSSSLQRLRSQSLPRARPHALEIRPQQLDPRLPRQRRLPFPGSARRTRGHVGETATQVCESGGGSVGEG